MISIDQRSIRQLMYRIRHDYVTPNNLLAAAALVVALSWVWGSIEAMQKNYHLQQTLDAKKQQVELETLRIALLEYEAKYYQSIEYKELAVRQRFGRGQPGERQLIVPSTDEKQPVRDPAKPMTHTTNDSNFQQWMNFLFGARRS